MDASGFVIAGVTVLAILLGLAWQRERRQCAEAHERLAVVERELVDRDAALRRAAQQRIELLANVSHDLRTPLAVMRGQLEMLLLLDGAADRTEARNGLQTAVRQSELLSRLVGDLFDLTRLESGELKAAPEPFCLAELAHDIAQQHAGEAQRRGIALDCDGPGAGARVDADMALVSRVIEALLDNALRHTPHGGHVAIAIDHDGERIVTEVRDDGRGMDRETLASVFDRYDRIARVRGGAQPGHAGLGLAIARRIVRLHGGDLRIASSPGEGTRVAFDLPVAAAVASRIAA